MKTPRTLLLQRHRAIVPKLDSVRRQALERLPAALALSSSENAAAAGRFQTLVTLAFRSVRWHLAGMGAVWIAITALTLNQGPAEERSLTGQASASPEQILTSLRQNRRQLTEWLSSSTEQPPAEPRLFFPKRRSEISTSAP